ncbi:MAG: hypothetical protein ACE5JU_08920 [Candidatus Binatia bacterium]
MVNEALYHLDLEEAYRELWRIVKPEGEIICTEALWHNVFIHLYWKMTPHLRSAWDVEDILGKKQIEMARQCFDRVEVSKFFHLDAIAAVPFRKMAIFDASRRGLEMVDSVLLRLPVLKWQAWIVVFMLPQPKKVMV